MKINKSYIIILLILSSLDIFSQINEENLIFESILNSYYASKPNDTVFDRKGRIKKINNYSFHKNGIVLINETYLRELDLPYSFLQERGLLDLDSTTLENYRIKNTRTIIIDSISDFSRDIIYMTKSEIDKIFDRGGFENYNKKFGYRDLVNFSRPGLNNERDQAFVYFSASSSGLSGIGLYFLLEKINDNWVVTGSIMAWIS